jgi:hypothetical protein
MLDHLCPPLNLFWKVDFFSEQLGEQKTKIEKPIHNKFNFPKAKQKC